MLSRQPITMATALHSVRQSLLPSVYRTQLSVRSFSSGRILSKRQQSSRNRQNNKNDTTDALDTTEPQQPPKVAGRLWSWGAGCFGGLGHNDSYAAKATPSVIPSTAHLLFSSVAAGWCRNIAITTDGQLYEWGWKQQIRSLTLTAKLYNRFPSLLLWLQSLPINTKFLFRPTATISPMLVSTFEHEISTDAHGNTLAVPEVRIVRSNSHYIRAVAAVCSSDWQCVLDDAGCVWTTGNGHYGQLGHNSSISNTNLQHYKRIELMVGAAVVAIAAGFNHLLLLTADGRCYSCGRSRDGQLGLPLLNRQKQENNSYRLFLPHLIPATCSESSNDSISSNSNSNSPYIGAVTAIAAGMKHSVFLVGATGSVYTCGHNLYGELGHTAQRTTTTATTAATAAGITIDSDGKQHTPTRVTGIPHPVTQIASGSHHVVVLCSNGYVYSWGLGKHGQCGRSSSEATATAEAAAATATFNAGRSTTQAQQLLRHSYLPGRVLLPPQLLAANDVVVAVRCGFYDTVLITKHKKTIIFGSLFDQHNQQETAATMSAATATATSTMPRVLMPHSVGAVSVVDMAFGLAHGLLLVADEKQRQ